MNGVGFEFLIIHSGNFERLHNRILKFTPVGVFRETISSAYSLEEYCSNQTIVFYRSTVLC